jgi:hypothetical protein
VHSSFKNRARHRLAALLCACTFALVAAGCHNNNQDSGFGVTWTTLSLADDVGPFTSYIVSIDSVVLVGQLNGAITAIGVPETVDLTRLQNFSELWAAASVPVDTYTSAIITMDYTTAQIAVMVNGVPVKATLKDPSGAALTTVAVTVNFDTSNKLTLQPTFATSNAVPLAFTYDLTASDKVDFTTSPPTVTITPFMSVSTTATDNRLIRIRGPLINSSVNAGTYTIVVRPFFDEVNSIGTMTFFNGPNTVYTLDGTTYVGPPGLTQLSQTSAGTTMTAAFCTFMPTPTLAPTINAGIFNPVYVIAGSTLEDFFTYGIEGDVIARNGNVLTVRGGTLFANLAQLVQYEITDSQVTLGPATQVTADGIAAGPLNFNSVSVGQHITARGIYSVSAAGVTMLDSTGSSTDTGSVRIQSTQLFGPLISTGTNSLTLNLQAINNWPSSIYNFAGNGVAAAQDPSAANYLVNTGALTLPTAAAGDPLWVDGFTSPFGSAPPDFNAEAVNAAPTVPASLVVSWTGTGTTAPFATLTSTGMTIDLANAAFGAGSLRIGADTIDIKTLSVNPTIVPAVAVPASNGLPLIAPLFSVGPGAITEAAVANIQSFNGFAAYVTQLNTTFAAPTAATQLVARGFYNGSANTFTASSIDVVL